MKARGIYVIRLQYDVRDIYQNAPSPIVQWTHEFMDGLAHLPNLKKHV
jgi:hypothetical protein